MAVLLYYPLVKPPTEILHQALLYWDGIASIVPQERREYDVAVPAELQELQERRLYTPVTFELGDMEELDDPEWRRDRGQASRVLLQELRRMAVPPNRHQLSFPDAYLYGSKMSLWLERELLSLRLARPFRGDYWSLVVPQEVQQLVIGTLAREIAAGRRVSYIPCTDRVDAHAWALRPAGEDRLPAWELELGKLLPLPVPGTPTADVVAFRERYADERHRLMRAVHRMLGDLRRDYEHPADVLAQLRREIEESVDDYRAAARSSRMAWVDRSVMVTLALAAAAGGVVQPGLTWVLGAVGGYALNVATREIRPLSRARRDHDFSYLHRVGETLT
ncbi:hypothetical protein ACIGPN_33725 [Streptomyces afghaniensis]